MEPGLSFSHTVTMREMSAVATTDVDYCDSCNQKVMARPNLVCPKPFGRHEFLMRVAISSSHSLRLQIFGRIQQEIL